MEIHARGLVKGFGGQRALDGFDLAVPAGAVHGLLGPNGAGKTTAVRVLTTLLRPDAGTVRVAGHDAAAEPAAVRAAIGLLGQHAALDEVLSGRQNLELFGRLHHLGVKEARRRAGELLERFGLAEAASRPVSGYSGGMRRRLDLAVCLIRSPRVLFLDEPTTGLDPRARAEVWEAVRSLVGGGATVLLTTQYLEEADRLADRISVVERGRVVAEGTPGELKDLVGGDLLDLVVREAGEVERAARVVESAVGSSPVADSGARRLGVPVTDRIGALTSVLRALEEAGVAVEDVAVRRPTLDEVFLHLTKERA
ncbi:ATP-binding cassette domain-containing protein [Actinocorallia libanotica]